MLHTCDLFIKNTTAEYGYSVGDVIPLYGGAGGFPEIILTLGRDRTP
jgi:hypothetical protein